VLQSAAYLVDVQLTDRWFESFRQTPRRAHESLSGNIARRAVGDCPTSRGRQSTWPKSTPRTNMFLHSWWFSS
jgi:hypothetical protein